MAFGRHDGRMADTIEISPDTMTALAGQLRTLGETLEAVERLAADGTGAAGDPAVALALETFDDSWDRNRAVLVADLLAGADALDQTATVFRQQDDLLAELLRYGKPAPTTARTRRRGPG